MTIHAGSMTDRILDLLETSNQAYTIAEIAEALNADVHHVRRTLYRMHHKGLARRRLVLHLADTRAPGIRGGERRMYYQRGEWRVA